MENFLSNLSVTPFLVIGGIALVIIGMLSIWRKVPQDKALIVSGLKKRVTVGSGTFVIPLVERADILSLESIKINVKVRGALTSQGVGINAEGVAVIKPKADEESILTCLEQFNTGTEDGTVAKIADIATEVLSGKLREIISSLTLEKIYSSRSEFIASVQEVAESDLALMGLEIKAFTIQDLSDSDNYIINLGKPRIAEVQKNADIAQAEFKRDTDIKTAKSLQEGEAAKLEAQVVLAEVEKEKELKIQAYREEKESAKAKADNAYKIEDNIVRKKVTESEMEVAIIRKEREIELTKMEAVKREEELNATVKKTAEARKYEEEKAADAKKYREIADAEANARAIELEGKARAEALKLQALAEAEAIREKGKAEAEAMKQKAEAFKLYNDAAMVQMMIDKLPQIAEAIASPLAKTEKIVIVDNGGEGKGASKVTGYVTDIMSQLPETMQALTGVDLNGILSSLSNKDKEDEN